MGLPQAILFDADGTLYDSDQLHFEAYQLVAKKLYGFDFTWQLFLDELVHGSKKILEVLTDHGIAVDEDAFRTHKRAVFDELARTKLQAMPGLDDFLIWCEQKKIRRAIVSAATHSSLASALTALKIHDHFEHVVGHEDIGARRKPDAYPYLHGLEKVGLPAAHVIAVEDTAKGIASAKGAGVRCVGIRNAMNSAQELEQADHIIGHYDDLQAYLTQQKP